MKESNGRNYSVDFLKILFSILIVSLHINFENGSPAVLRCLSRVGVPFFFAVTGYYLTTNYDKATIKKKVLKYLRHVAQLLIVWYIIYSPILIGNYYELYGADIQNMLFRILQEFLFKAPAFLWYLSSGMLGAALIYIFWSRRKLAFILAIVLYIIGTAGNSYLVFYPTINSLQYYSFFLTTRNGLFFAFPIMTCASYIHDFIHIDEKRSLVLPITISAFILYTLEFGIISAFDTKDYDTSMYFTLPLITCVLLYWVLTLPIKLKPSNIEYLPDVSSGIYLMQFGFITVMTYYGMKPGLIWFVTVVLAVIVTIILQKVVLIKKILL